MALQEAWHCGEPQNVNGVLGFKGVSRGHEGTALLARYGFAGAVRGLAVSNGLLFDLGGGSLQITRFASRRLAKGVSLPFGALRV